MTQSNRVQSLVCGNKTLDLSSPCVMGILNVAPSSFSPVGRHTALDKALKHAERMFYEGASIIDIGGEPTNPGVHPITSEQEELDRVIPAIEAISRELPIPISVDTSKPSVIKAAIHSGASFINDVRALRAPASLEVVAKAGIPVCLMHMLYPTGIPSQTIPLHDPITSIKTFLQARIDACCAAGISRNNIVIDPGIGHGSFGKTQQQNLWILNQLDRFADMPFPLLLGVSRKTFIGNILNQPAQERLYGSLSAATIAVMKGAMIIRAHDVKETVDAIKVAWEILQVCDGAP